MPLPGWMIPTCTRDTQRRLADNAACAWRRQCNVRRRAARLHEARAKVDAYDRCVRAREQQHADQEPHHGGCSAEVASTVSSDVGDPLRGVT